MSRSREQGTGEPWTDSQPHYLVGIAGAVIVLVILLLAARAVFEYLM
jgi:hypothetical protein